MTSMHPAAAPTRRAFLCGALAFGVPPLTLSRTLIAVAGLTPEQFGAAGDGHRDDSRAIAEAIATAAARGVPLLLGEGRRYALGAPGWRGIDITVHAPVAIEGRGATMALRARPAQSFAIGAGNPTIRFTGGAVTVRNLNFDLGGLEAAAMEFCDAAIHVEGCSFANGFASNTSFGLYVNRSQGAILANSARDIGHLFYVGHTDPGWYSHDLRIAGNRAQNLAADFVVGVLQNATIADNVGDGMFSGVALAAFARMRSVSENVTVTRNRFSNFRGNGIQTDTIGDLRLRNILVRDNVLRDGGPNAAGLYLLRIERFEAARNTVENTSFGIVLDAAARGAVTNNRITAGPRRPITGLYMPGDLGPIEDIEIIGNVVDGYEVGVSIGGSPAGGARRVGLHANEFVRGGRGIVIMEPAAELAVEGNLLSGNRGRDLDIHSRGVRLSANRTGGR